MNAQLPPEQMRLTLDKAGDRWDAVRVSTTVGAQVMSLLGEACGSVVSDGLHMWFFVEPGEGQALTMPGVTTYLSGSHVLIPAGCVTSLPGPHWARTGPERSTPAAHLLLAVQEYVR